MYGTIRHTRGILLNESSSESYLLSTGSFSSGGDFIAEQSCFTMAAVSVSAGDGIYLR